MRSHNYRKEPLWYNPVKLLYVLSLIFVFSHNAQSQEPGKSGSALIPIIKRQSWLWPGSHNLDRFLITPLRLFDWCKSR